MSRVSGRKRGSTPSCEHCPGFPLRRRERSECIRPRDGGQLVAEGPKRDQGRAPDMLRVLNAIQQSQGGSPRVSHKLERCLPEVRTQGLDICQATLNVERAGSSRASWERPVPR